MSEGGWSAPSIPVPRVPRKGDQHDKPSYWEPAGWGRLFGVDYWTHKRDPWEQRGTALLDPQQTPGDLTRHYKRLLAPPPAKQPQPTGPPQPSPPRMGPIDYLYALLQLYQTLFPPTPATPGGTTIVLPGTPMPPAPGAVGAPSPGAGGAPTGGTTIVLPGTPMPPAPADAPPSPGAGGAPTGGTMPYGMSSLVMPGGNGGLFNTVLGTGFDIAEQGLIDMGLNALQNWLVGDEGPATPTPALPSLPTAPGGVPTPALAANGAVKVQQPFRRTACGTGMRAVPQPFVTSNPMSGKTQWFVPARVRGFTMTHVPKPRRGCRCRKR